MNNTISDLWKGNLAPCEYCGSRDPQLEQILTLMERNRENLCSSLNPEQAEVFQKYVDCAGDCLFRTAEIALCDGFSLGSRLLAEALSE